MATETTYDNGVTPGKGANKEDLRGARKRRKPSAIAGARQSDLDVAMNEAAAAGGGIQAGAHPEFDQPTPGEKIGAWIKKLFPPKPKKAQK